VPQWESRHSGSSPTTPERTPEKLPDAPTVKMLDFMQERTGWTRDRCVKLFKSLYPETVSALCAWVFSEQV
jgi:hypothetical protein